MESYEVDTILNKRKKSKHISYLDGKDQYLVKWKGYSAAKATWEPKENLGNCSEMLVSFEMQQLAIKGSISDLLVPEIPPPVEDCY